MYLIETCPECGHNIIPEVICTIPPINVRKCYKCGWEHEEKTEVVYISYKGVSE